MLLLKRTLLGFALTLGFIPSVLAGLYGFNDINPYSDEEKILHMDSPPRHIVNYRLEMRNNINMLSSYAKKHNPNFVILVHEDEDVLGKSKWEFDLEGYNQVMKKKTNAQDELFLNHDPVPTIFTASVDGIVKNNLLCGENKLSQNLIDSNLTILSIDYCPNEKDFDIAIEKSIEEETPFYGFINKSNAFKKIKKQPIVKENVDNIYKLSDAKNMNVFIDDSLYQDKQTFINDIANSNYDIVIIKPLFHDKDALTMEEIIPLKLKKNGTKRLLLAQQNISEAKPSDYFWGKKWKKKNPNWIKRDSFSQEGAFIIEYWNNNWKKIISNYLKSIVDTGYDGVFLTGLENHYYFEKQTPLN